MKKDGEMSKNKISRDHMPYFVCIVFLSQLYSEEINSVEPQIGFS